MNTVNDSEPLAGLSVLIVEDELTIAMLLEDTLDCWGCHDVTLAPSVERALSSLAQRMFSGVLLDMNLHGRSSVAVAEELIRRSVPFLLVTGYGAQDSDPPAIKAAPRLQKPFTGRDLVRSVREVFLPPVASRPADHATINI